MNFKYVNILKAIFSSLLVLLLLNGCNKKDEPASPDTGSNGKNGKDTLNVKMGTLLFHLHHYIDENEIYEYNTINRTEDGRKISISLAQLYLSGFEVERLDGTFYKIPGSLILKEQSNTTYKIGNVPAGNYKSIRFQVGLTDDFNNKLPSSESDLLNRKEMWFNASASGNEYIYFNIKGKVDTTSQLNASDNQLIDFNYSIGTSKNLIQVVIPSNNFTVLPDKSEFIHFKIILSKIFNGLDLTNNNNLHITTIEDNNKDIVTKLKSNISSMFVSESL